MGHNGVHRSQRDLAKVFSSVRLLGPPMGDKLVSLVGHLFSPEEAEIALTLPFYRPRPLAQIAKKMGCPKEQIDPLLRGMSQRRVIVGGRKGYFLIPIMPGMFEYLLMGGADSTWHRRYAELLLDLWSEGFVERYTKTKIPAVRSIAVGQEIDTKNRVVDVDFADEMIDAHKHLCVLNVCQCRQTMRFTDRQCKRSSPEDGCLVFGSFARGRAKKGDGRLVSKQEMRDIVAERREKKMILFAGNVAAESPNAICTCCSCCCHGVHAINHYGARAVVAPPRYLIAVDKAACDDCGACVKPCNTFAHKLENKVHSFDISKCVGCGICVNQCKRKAITLIDNAAYRPPSKNFTALSLKLLPNVAFATIRAKLGA